MYVSTYTNGHLQSQNKTFCTKAIRNSFLRAIRKVQSEIKIQEIIQ